MDSIKDLGVPLFNVCCLQHLIFFQTKLLSRPKEAPPPLPEPEPVPDEQTHYDKMELKKLQTLLLQRDNEISILFTTERASACVGLRLSLCEAYVVSWLGFTVFNDKMTSLNGNFVEFLTFSGSAAFRQCT